MPFACTVYLYCPRATPELKVVVEELASKPGRNAQTEYRDMIKANQAEIKPNGHADLTDSYLDQIALLLRIWESEFGQKPENN